MKFLIIFAFFGGLNVVLANEQAQSHGVVAKLEMVEQPAESAPLAPSAPLPLAPMSPAALPPAPLPSAPLPPAQKPASVSSPANPLPVGPAAPSSKPSSGGFQISMKEINEILAKLRGIINRPREDRPKEDRPMAHSPPDVQGRISK